MARRKSSLKLNIPMFAAFVLFCLTVISGYFSNGIYAKYAVTSYDEEYATVASFEVTESKRYFTEELVLPLAPGEYETDITVENKSDVAISYSITVENVTLNLPLLFEVGEGDGTRDKHVEAFYMEARSDATYTLRIIWPPEDSLKYMGMVDLIKITLRAEQIN